MSFVAFSEWNIGTVGNIETHMLLTSGVVIYYKEILCFLFHLAITLSFFTNIAVAAPKISLVLNFGTI